jgi:hypothetical protein
MRQFDRKTKARRSRALTNIGFDQFIRFTPNEALETNGWPG